MKVVDALALAGANIARSRTEGQNSGGSDANHPRETDSATEAEGEWGGTRGFRQQRFVVTSGFFQLSV